eukprot:m.869843 g.869843  ORF g.869843 m.869843 type:complete len:184 (-) comp59747_c0_seq1:5303-5854(-)
MSTTTTTAPDGPIDPKADASALLIPVVLFVCGLLVLFVLLTCRKYHERRGERERGNQIALNARRWQYGDGDHHMPAMHPYPTTGFTAFSMFPSRATTDRTVVDESLPAHHNSLPDAPPGFDPRLPPYPTALQDFGGSAWQFDSRGSLIHPAFESRPPTVSLPARDTSDLPPSYDTLELSSQPK